MMNPNLKREKRILNISFIGSLLFLITEIVVAFITKSNAVIMDCVYDFADLVMIGPFILLVPLLYKTETEKRPYGYSQVESLFIMIKSTLLILATLFLVIDSIVLLFQGGNDINASVVAIFELFVSFTCIIMFIVLSKLSRKYTSPSIEAELYIWKLDSLSTLAVGIAFLIKLFLDFTKFSFLSPYVDPLIAIILAGLLLKEPIGLFVDSVRNIILFAPDEVTNEIIKDAVDEVLEKNGYYDNFLDVIKTGRKIWIEVYCVTKDDKISVDKLREMNDEIYEKLDDEFDSLYIELIPDVGKVKRINQIKMKTRRPDKIRHIKRVENKKKKKKTSR